MMPGKKVKIGGNSGKICESFQDFWKEIRQIIHMKGFSNLCKIM